MKNILKYAFFIFLMVNVIGCSKPNTANGKFVGTWHEKTGTDTAIFYSNGSLKLRGDALLTSYSVISADSIQFNSYLPQSTHRSYYQFISATELYIQAYEDNQIGTGFYSDTLVKN